MNGRGFITISMHELRRVKVIDSVVEGRLSGVRAAEQLGLSERQVSRLRRRFEASGAAGSGFRQAWQAEQPAVLDEPTGTGDCHHPGALCRFWADAQRWIAPSWQPAVTIRLSGIIVKLTNDAFHA